ncbi:alpha/beta fold hydrolase [Photobacterium gaetbulicola]|uniref:alpha/beta fold hydrolase n=1 Tax=Photobacterium gaetbulicola TaxID=1295392 RepID=UPI00068C83A9|nr:alpha/beta hydrolase [Photobacterium gaetbulicola]
MYKKLLSLPALLSLAGCITIPSTVDQDTRLSFTEINGYKFHTVIEGSNKDDVVIVVHGGPGGDHKYLTSLNPLSKNHQTIFYDQRGAGLSPRVDKRYLTIERYLDDLDALVEYYSSGKKVKLIGHSFGGMLVTGYLSAHPKKVSHAVIVEPGMLDSTSAEKFVTKMKASQSAGSLFFLIRHMAAYPFVRKYDGYEGFDYVMTKILNRSEPGAPFQCEHESMPSDAFTRGGYEAFNTMLRPVINDPAAFHYDLTEGISSYRGKLMLISSECSYFGYEFQDRYHMPKLPTQTVHVMAKGMGHNMLTLNPEWSLETIIDFFDEL